MPDTKSRFLNKILEGKDAEPDPAKSFTTERQHTAQAFNLHVERRDGRRSEGFAWSHYLGYLWTDEGNHERLVVIFGVRAIEIEGHHLGVLVAEIREGQLNSIRELSTGQGMLLATNNPDNEPVITSVKTFPDLDEILKDIKGDDKDGSKGGFAQRFGR
jgi:hypothetical protein